MLFFINKQLLVLTSVFIPIIYFIGTLVRKKIIQCSQEQTLSSEKFLLHLDEALRGFADIKIFQAENKISNSLKNIRRNLLEVERTQTYYQRMYRDVTGFLFSTLPLLILVVGLIFFTTRKNNFGNCYFFLHVCRVFC